MSEMGMNMTKNVKAEGAEEKGRIEQLQKNIEAKNKIDK